MKRQSAITSDSADIGNPVFARSTANFCRISRILGLAALMLSPVQLNAATSMYYVMDESQLI